MIDRTLNLFFDERGFYAEKMLKRVQEPKSEKSENSSFRKDGKLVNLQV
ncbi:MAG: hypothetical protein IJ808_05915 [Muribaculaceae bacterium]|nr:hypothetical protein [Muribaculaceae bacterium]